MKRKYIPLLTLLVLILLLAGACGSQSQEASDSASGAGSAAISSDENSGADAGTANDLGPAADFVVFDADGAEHRLADYIGHPIVLNFWASWCGPCRQEMPYFDDAFAEYGDQVIFLMVNATDGTSETQETAQSYIDESRFLFPVYFDLEGSACSAYRITAFPTTWFIDSNGRVAGYHVGSMSAQDLADSLKDILPENN